MRKIKRYVWLSLRLIFAAWYFGVGVVGFIINNRTKDIAQATTALEKAMAESSFLNPLLCLCCTLGGAALFFRRSSPLGLVILAPLVIIIFCFHMMITKDYWWGAINFVLLVTLIWHFRWGLVPLWNYTSGE